MDRTLSFNREQMLQRLNVLEHENVCIWRIYRKYMLSKTTATLETEPMLFFQVGKADFVGRNQFTKISEFEQHIVIIPDKEVRERLSRRQSALLEQAKKLSADRNDMFKTGKTTIWYYIPSFSFSFFKF